MRKILLCLALTLASTLAIKCQPKFTKLAQACSENLASEAADRRASFLQNKLAQSQCNDLETGLKTAETIEVESYLDCEDKLKSQCYKVFGEDRDTQGIMSNLKSDDCRCDFNLQGGVDFSGIENDMKNYKAHGDMGDL